MLRANLCSTSTVLQLMARVPQPQFHLPAPPSSFRHFINTKPAGEPSHRRSVFWPSPIPVQMIRMVSRWMLPVRISIHETVTVFKHLPQKHEKPVLGWKIQRSVLVSLIRRVIRGLKKKEFAAAAPLCGACKNLAPPFGVV